MVRMKVLNIYKLNIYQILNFIFKITTNTAMYFRKPISGDSVPILN